MPHLDTYIAGAKFRPGSLKHLEALNGEHGFTLEPEPGNAFDPHAVKILDGAIHIGYVPSHLAVKVGKLIEKGRLTSVRLVRQGSHKIEVHYQEKA